MALYFEAAFIFVRTKLADRWAAVTRPCGGGVGLPGGKIEPDESPREAALREAREEGWLLPEVTTEMLHRVHDGIVDGHRVIWYWVPDVYAVPMDRYKEMSRISPVPATLGEIAAGGFSNPEAIEGLWDEMRALERADAQVRAAEHMATALLDALYDSVAEYALIRRFDPEWRGWPFAINLPDGSGIYWDEGNHQWEVYK